MRKTYGPPNIVITRLPFINDNDCGLGIAVRTYLDDLPLQSDPTSSEARAEVKAKGKDWFQHSDSFSGNLDMAFKLFDAVSPHFYRNFSDACIEFGNQVHKATQSASKEVKEVKTWENAHSWLAERR